MKDTDFTGGDISKYYDEVIRPPLFDRMPIGMKVAGAVALLAIVVFGFGIGH